MELSSSQYLRRADTASLSITGDITIEAWIKLEQLPTTPVSTFFIAGKYDPGTPNDRSYALFISGANDKAIVQWSSDGTTSNLNSVSMDTAFAGGDVGTWVHLAVSIDVSLGESAEFYKNGSPVAETLDTDNNATSIDDNASEFTVGARDKTDTGWAQFFDGLIDEVRVWNDIRSAAEILANYNIELTGSEAGLVGYWKLNNDYTDSQASGLNDLTAVASPVFSTDVPFVGRAAIHSGAVGYPHIF